MNITFMIGNGFDLNLGLQTRYTDFYPYFLKRVSKNNIIASWIDGEEQLWADMELKLGAELIWLDENGLEQFYDDKEELDRLLMDYLEEQQKKISFDNEEDIINKFKKDILNFYCGLPINDMQSLKETLTKYKDEQFTYEFISFNYTKTLDSIIQLYKSEGNNVIATHSGFSNKRNEYIGNVLHIHGTLEEEMILGVNDESQIGNYIFVNDSLFLDTFIKSRINKSIGQQKTEKAKEIISNSHIICIFGMSIGDTDTMWWEEIVNWLLINKNNKLVIYWRTTEIALYRKVPAKIIRLNNNIKNGFIKKGARKHTDEKLEAIKEQIIIAYNHNIFSYDLMNNIPENI